MPEATLDNNQNINRRKKESHTVFKLCRQFESYDLAAIYKEFRDRCEAVIAGGTKMDPFRREALFFRICQRVAQRNGHMNPRVHFLGEWRKKPVCKNHQRKEIQNEFSLELIQKIGEILWITENSDSESERENATDLTDVLSNKLAFYDLQNLEISPVETSQLVEEILKQIRQLEKDFENTFLPRISPKYYRDNISEPKSDHETNVYLQQFEFLRVYQRLMADFRSGRLKKEFSGEDGQILWLEKNGLIEINLARFSESIPAEVMSGMENWRVISLRLISGKIFIEKLMTAKSILESKGIDVYSEEFKVSFSRIRNFFYEKLFNKMSLADADEKSGEFLEFLRNYDFFLGSESYNAFVREYFQSSVFDEQALKIKARNSAINQAKTEAEKTAIRYHFHTDFKFPPIPKADLKNFTRSQNIPDEFAAIILSFLRGSRCNNLWIELEISEKPQKEIPEAKLKNGDKDDRGIYEKSADLDARDPSEIVAFRVDIEDLDRFRILFEEFGISVSDGAIETLVEKIADSEFSIGDFITIAREKPEVLQDWAGEAIES
jgi:hypothetical protein